MKTYLRYLITPAIIFSLCLSYTGSFAQKYKDRGQQKQEEEYKQTRDNQDSLGNKSFFDRLVYGGNLMLEIGNPTYIDLSPLVGYRITPKLQAGVGGTYVYDREVIPQYDAFGNYLGSVAFSTSLYGGRFYAEYDILHDALRPSDRLFGHFEYEVLNVPRYDNYGQLSGRSWMESPYIGAGYRSPLGRRGFINLTVLYNMDYARFATINPYGTPWAIRIGFTL
jgi:hypothetical protein